MRRLLAPLVFGSALFVCLLIIPRGTASAEKLPIEVTVTNVPLPVTVPAPRPFAGRDAYIVPAGTLGVAGGGTFVAPPNSTIETISVRVLLPAGQKPSATLFVLDDAGRGIGDVWVPLQLQGNTAAGDVYVGTLTNVHAPVGTTTAGRTVNFEIDRDGTTGVATATVTVIGLSAS